MINILVSYAYMDKQELAFVQRTAPHVRWLLDSGAFTAFHAGSPIDIGEYTTFVLKYGGLFHQYIALDVLRDAGATRRNLTWMRERGARPMPVLTVDEHVRMAVEVTEDADHLCIAGGTSTPIEFYGPRLQEVRNRVRPEVRIHGLGFTRGMRVARTAVDSVDSSTWLSGKRWGSFQWFDPTFGVRHVPWKELRAMSWGKIPAAVRRALMALGLSGDELKRPTMSVGAFSTLSVQSAYATLAYSSAMERRGVRNFFVANNPRDAVQLLIAAKHCTRRRAPIGECDRDGALWRSGQLDVSKLAEQASAQVEKEWSIR